MLTTLLKQWRSIIGLAGITVVSIGVGFASASSSVSNSIPEEEADSKFKVAIIGTGIGGSSAAYFIHNLLGRDASIDVFDRASKVGGRIAVIEMDDNMFESGGSVIHDSNKYMTEFCKMGGKFFLCVILIFRLRGPFCDSGSMASSLSLNRVPLYDNYKIVGNMLALVHLE